MVDVGIKTAVEKATEFAKASLGPERTVGLRLEEIESSEVDGEEVWLITLSSPLTSEGSLASLNAVAVALGADLGREYKVFTVRKRTGEVVSMKIRLLAAPTTR
jgi:hypothetical protein